MKKKTKKSLKNKDKDKDIVFNILKTICLIGIGIVLVELLIFCVLVITRNKDVNVDLSQKIINTDNGYVTSGSSNFYNSNYIKKLDREIAKITIYEKDKIINEFKFDKYYRSVFYDIKEIDDGYIAVGTAEKDSKGHDKGLKDALIVRFNKSGKVIWSKLYNELDDAYFRSFIITNNSIIVVGSSIYESDVIGNEKKGGAIVVKYDLDGNKIINNHFCGNKSGAFNDIVMVGDNYYAVGSDTSSVGLIVKLNNNLEKLSSINLKGVNRDGVTSLVNANNSLYIAYSKTKEDKKKTLEEATIVQYNYNLEKQKEQSFVSDDYSIWNDIIDYNGNLYLVGDAAKKKSKKNSLLVKYIYHGIYAKYNYDLTKVFDKQFKYNNSDFYKSIIIKDNIAYVAGFTNSDIKELNSSEYNYVSFINKYDLDGNLIK